MKNINYDILIQAEKVRYQSDFSSAHWMHQVISNYMEMKPSKLREAYEKVLRIAIKFGTKRALKEAEKYNKMKGFPGFPSYLLLDDYDEWKETQEAVLVNWEIHLKNRFGYFRDGD
jgi:hypothetical protein